MKVLMKVCIFLISLSAVASEKIYTKEEFDQKLKESVEKKILVLKNKTLTQLTKEILEKESKLDTREEILKSREEQIKISESTLLKKIEELESEKKKIIGCLDNNDRTEAMRVTQLVSVVSNMKPQKAADLLSVQEASISIKIIEKIDPQKASKIFNLMDKEVSARLQKQYLNMQK